MPLHLHHQNQQMTSLNSHSQICVSWLCFVLIDVDQDKENKWKFNSNDVAVSSTLLYLSRNNNSRLRFCVKWSAHIRNQWQTLGFKARKGNFANQ